LAEILRLGPERLVYISCEPSTHARDLIALVRSGYRVRRAAIVDMFPQTYHIESVALLQRGGQGRADAPPPISWFGTRPRLRRPALPHRQRYCESVPLSVGSSPRRGSD